MMYEEVLRILRNEKWKFFFLIVLISIGYYFTMLQETSTQATGMFHILGQDKAYMVSALPVFLTCFLLYHIAGEEESQKTWKTLLAFPVKQRKRVFTKLCVLLVFQIPIVFMGMLVYFFITLSISSTMFHYALCLQLLYLLSFFYYTFVVASGYLDQGGALSIVNVLKTATPIFLLFCILNGSDWIFAFDMLWLFIMICFIIMMALLFFLLDLLMRRKLYREMILFKIFGSIAKSQVQTMMEGSKNFMDTCLQALFRLPRCHSASYWRAVGAIEISLKLNGFYVLIGCVCLILWESSNWQIFFPLSIVSFLYVIFNCVRERKNIKGIRIL